MTNFKVLLYLLFLSNSVLGQVRVSKLVIKSNETYTLSETDILVADTLIMMDSSRLVLNKLKPDNFIRTKVAIIGSYCVIDGKGLPGKAGRQAEAVCPIIHLAVMDCQEVQVRVDLTGALALIFFYTRIMLAYGDLG